MKVYTSKEIIENITDAAERAFVVTISSKQFIEPSFRSLLEFLRNLSLHRTQRWDINDDPIARARFVGTMIGKAYGNADSALSYYPTVSCCMLTEALGFTLGVAVYRRCEKDIFMAKMDATEANNSIETELETNRLEERGE